MIYHHAGSRPLDFGNSRVKVKVTGSEKPIFENLKLNKIYSTNFYKIFNNYLLSINDPTELFLEELGQGQGKNQIKVDHRIN